MGFFEFLTGQKLFDAWFIGDAYSPDPLNVVINGKNRRDEARKRDFKALERQLRSIKSTRRAFRRGQDR